jgi:amino acid transporter
MSEASSQRRTGATKFGTFGGVFTPNVLTILGVIMFLRFGQITGQAGVVNAVLILACAKLITSLTAVSLSAIATNTRVKGGGAYYLISRSLGVEFGGGIAFVFYLAQAVSVAMYVIGFAEAFVTAFPEVAYDQRTVATVANLGVFLTVIVGAGWTIKIQYGILAVLALALVSFALGVAPNWASAQLLQNASPAYLSGENALTMFALFFPAATGIMAGANMSGDLRDPAKALPLGTFGAIGITTIVYFALILGLGGAIGREDLIRNGFVMHDVARWPALIVAGVFAATLSSALGSMMGAPRILQAFARDGIFKRIEFLGKGSGPSAEPRRAIVVTAVVSQSAILLGDLDAIAPIITMFFMVTYGTLNLASFYEGYSRNPSFRPRFRYSHWSLSLAGTIGCLVAMLLMDAAWAIASLTAMGALYWAIRRIGIKARWGDVRSGMAFERVRRALLKLEEQPLHPKNWRPIILGLGVSQASRHEIVEFGHWFTAGHGVLSLAQVISGEVEDRLERSYQAERLLRQFIVQEEIAAFPTVVVDEDLLEGIKALLQCHGIGTIKPNCVLMAWTGDPEEFPRYAEMLRLSKRLQRNIVIIKREEERERWSLPDGEIHIWWHGRRNGPLMLILAHLLASNPEFRHKEVKLIHVVPEETAREQAQQHLVEITQRARIDVEPTIVVTENLLEALIKTSRDAGIVMLGFDPPEEGAHIQFLQDIEILTDQLHDVVLVCAAHEIDLNV